MLSKLDPYGKTFLADKNKYPNITLKNDFYLELYIYLNTVKPV